MWSVCFRKEPKKGQDIFLSNFFNHGFETRSFPNSLAATLRGFTFYLAVPISSIRG